MTDETKTDETTVTTADVGLTAEVTSDEKLKRVLGGEVIIAPKDAGGVSFQKMGEVVQIAQLMARSGAAIPKHLRGQAGMCWAICLYSIEWKLSPLFVANKSYVVNDRLAFESQLVHAVIEMRAPLTERLSARYEGEGEERVCIVSGRFKGETKPREFRSSPLKDLHPGYTKIREAEEGGRGKKRIPFAEGLKLIAEGLKPDEQLVPAGSPLWDKKPDLQLFYNASRDWGRMYCPGEIGGIYTDEEIVELTPGDHARDVTELHERLSQASETSTGEGFHDGVVDEGLNGGEATSAAPVRATPSKTTKQARSEGKALVSRARRSKAIDSAASKKGHRSRKRQAALSEHATFPERGPARTEVEARLPKVKDQPVHEPSGKPSPIPPRPKTVAEYGAYVKAWLKAETSAAEVQGRWARERALRNQCNLTQEDRLPLEEIKNKRVEALSK